MDSDLIKRVRPFVIRKPPTSLGQDRIEDSVVHFSKYISEVLMFTSNLKLSSLMSNPILIIEHLANVKTHSNYTLRPNKVNIALEWLHWNNKF